VTPFRCDPGTLRHRLILEAPAESGDGGGGVVRSWQAVAAVWARLEPLGAATTTHADAPVNRATHRLVLRWRSDLTTGHRFVAGARIFAITGLADPDERRRFLLATVEELSP
jgi:SPP1 family predicted phage head-tail adaptor